MEWPPVNLTAWMEAAPEGSYRGLNAHQEPTTISFPAMQSMLNTMRSSRLASPMWKDPYYSSLKSLVSSASTSLNTQRLDGSLYYIEYLTLDGWQTKVIGEAVAKSIACEMFETYAGVYKYCVLKVDVMTKTTEVVLASDGVDSADF